MNIIEIGKIFQTVQKQIFCPKCKKPYRFSQIHIIGARGGSYFIQLDCGQHPPVMAAVKVVGGIKIVDESQISKQELLESYQILNKFRGRVSNLWES